MPDPLSRGGSVMSWRLVVFTNLCELGCLVTRDMNSLQNRMLHCSHLFSSDAVPNPLTLRYAILRSIVLSRN